MTIRIRLDGAAKEAAGKPDGKLIHRERELLAARRRRRWPRGRRRWASSSPGTRSTVASPVVRQNQTGSRSVVFEAGGMRAIVAISPDGHAQIATFGNI